MRGLRFWMLRDGDEIVGLLASKSKRDLENAATAYLRRKFADHYGRWLDLRGMKDTREAWLDYVECNIDSLDTLTVLKANLDPGDALVLMAPKLLQCLGTEAFAICGNDGRAVRAIVKRPGAEGEEDA